MKITSHIGALLATSTALGVVLIGGVYTAFDEIREVDQGVFEWDLQKKEIEALEDNLKFFFLITDLGQSSYLEKSADDLQGQIKEHVERIGVGSGDFMSSRLAKITECTETILGSVRRIAILLQADDPEANGGVIAEIELENDEEINVLMEEFELIKRGVNKNHSEYVERGIVLRSRFLVLLLSGGLLYICLLTLLWRWTSKTVIDPVKELTREAEKAEDGDQEIKPLSGGPYEVKVLGRAISGLVHSLGQHQEILEETVKIRTQELVRANEDLLEEIVQRERAEDALRLHEEKKRDDHKMEALGRLAGGVAHDFNNLLTAIVGYSDLSINRMDEEDPEIESLKQIRLAGERASVLTRQLLLLGRKQVLDQVYLSLGVVASNMQKILQSMLGEKVSLVMEIEPDLPSIHADQGQLEQVLMNLAVNARDAIDGFGTVKMTIGTGEREIDGAEQVHLYVEDDGQGMNKETKARMFEPYFTTKPLEKGTGLGLSIVYGIIQQNEGEVEVVSSPGKGTTMRLFFSASDVPPINMPSTVREQIPAADQKKILLVEDEDVVRGLAFSTLEYAGYEVTQASDGVEAVALFKAHSGEFDLVVTDVVMPRMGGRELVQQISREKPDVKVLYISGHIADDEVQAEINNNGVPFLPKPFKPSELVSRVLEVIAKG
jgi:signal transduction histidine kinase